MMEKPDRTAEKRRRILEAARDLVLREGLRATTMEAIAREAGVAKPTLYAQFSDKNAVFAALIDLTICEIHEAADTGFRTAGTVWERVGEALARQYLALARIIGGSTHADEFKSEPRRSGFRFEERHLRTDARVVEELRSAGVEDAVFVARVITAAANGVFGKMHEPEAMAAAIKLVCRRLIEPALPSTPHERKLRPRS